MNAIATFDFNGHVLRAFGTNLDPRFLASEACEALGIDKPRDAVARLDPDERVPVVMDTLGGPQRVSAVTESGLFHLIFMSRKKEAVAFRKWVTSVVLPAIRRTGRYDHTAPRLIAGVEIGVELENHDHQRAASRTLSGTATSTADVIGKFVGISRAVSGQEPKDVRQLGRLLGFKSRECRSAPQVWRTQGAVEAPMHSALCLMIALGVTPEDAYRQAGPARDAIQALRSCFLNAGADPSVFAKIPRDEFDRLLSEAADRKRAADRQMSLFGA